VSKQLGINKDEEPVKTPDGSPLDFFGFGYLKQHLIRRRPSRLEGVWKISSEIWSSINQETPFANDKYRETMNS
jgi:hypothetical protein